MGRLIDADLLSDKIRENKELLQKGLGKDAEFAFVTADSVLKVIENQPTAYDVDAVVKQLEKKIQTHECCVEYEQKNGTITEEFQQRKAIEVLKDAIEIVKGGGVDA